MKKILSLASISLLLIVVATGCLKDKDFESNKYGVSKPDESPVGIGFPEAAKKINTFSILPTTTAQTFKVALVNLLSDKPAEQELNITIERDTSIAYNYNMDPETKTPVQEFASSEVASSFKVTIPQGQTTGYMDLTINNSSTLDLTKLYAIGLKIASVDKSGITISTNLQKMLIGVAIQNIYDGIYEVRSYTLRSGDAARTGPVPPYELELQTNGPTSVIFGSNQKWADGSGVAIGLPVFSVDPATNLVTATTDGSVSLAVPVGNDPSYNSRYEPATKTFYTSYTWNGGVTARLVVDTLIYLRPR